MTPQTITPPELTERYDNVVSGDFSVVEESREDPATSEVPHEHSLEGLSVERIRLRPARRIQ
ncbi:MAG TPA: hypothetical protein DCX60_04985 [Phycisphaerales bacterium]|nr:hypothetical protein [Phycisphaerales bacterium]